MSEAFKSIWLIMTGYGIARIVDLISGRRDFQSAIDAWLSLLGLS